MFVSLYKFIAAIVMVLIVSSCQSRAVVRNTPKILLPLYIYPNWYEPENYVWSDVVSAAAKVDIAAITNPNNGTDGQRPNKDCQRGLADLRATKVIFEQYPQAWEQYQPQAYVSNYKSENFASLIHSVPDAKDMKKYIDMAIARNIGYIYVTDDSPKNDDGDPWNSLPSYWLEEVDYIRSRINE